MPIVIFSETTDNTTNEVIKWLLHYHKDFIRINPQDFIEFSRQISNSSNTLSINGIKAEDINSVWYRRGHINVIKKEVFNIEGNNDLENVVNTHINHEHQAIKGHLHGALENCDKNTMTPFLSSAVNRLDVLQKAVKCGLDIPSTIVTNNKTELLGFLDIYPNSIMKACNTNFGFDNAFQFTEMISKEDLSGDENYIFPSLIQERIEKRMDIRTFILGKKIYSMAIFSQNNNSTKLDFRHYDFENFSQCIPYKLPDEQEWKLLALLDILNLKTGSVDFVYSNDKKHYFLEVNPIGQLGMVSAPCNYKLEREIAKYL